MRVPPGRQAHGTRTHGLLDQRLHLLLLLGCGRALLVGEHHAAHVVVPDEAGQVDRQPERAELLEKLVQLGCGTAAVPRHDRRHAVEQEVVGRGVVSDLGLDVGVHVDETRRDDPSVCVDDAPGRRPRERSDGCDPARADANVRAIPGIAGAVDDAAVADDHVVGDLVGRRGAGNGQGDGGEHEIHGRFRAHEIAIIYFEGSMTMAPFHAALATRLGYAFRDPSLCERALTHRSWINENPDDGRADNERLEFLGDAVIALVVSDLLMRDFPEWPEGTLSRARSAVVNEEGLARAAETLGLGSWIFLGRGEEQAGGRAKRSILSDALEALIGAVYLDGGFDMAHRVAKRVLQPLVADVREAADRDFKSRLQEVAQARLQCAPTYRVVSEQGPDHDKTFEVALFLGEAEYGRASGKSKKEAQQKAAALALAALDGAPSAGAARG